MAHLHIHDTVLSERRLPLPGRVVVLGRSLDVDVPIPHRSVSRRHALIERGPAGWLLSDLGSYRGSFVGDRRVGSGERVEIPLGGDFRVGDVVIRLAEDEPVLDRAPPASRPAAAAPAPPRAPALAAAPRVRRRAPDRDRPPVRRGEWRERRDAMRWLGVLATLVLLAIAGLFLAKIAGREAADPGAKEKKEKPAEPRRNRELKPLGGG